jgi:O-antigen ligase
MGDGEFASRLSGAPSDLINPNELGFVIATVLPFLHFFLLKGRWNLKVLYFILLPLMLYALILTMSRGAFLALLVVGWIIFKESRRKVVLIVLGIFIVIGGLSVMNDIQRDRYLSIFSSDAAQSKSRDGRINGIFREFELGLQRPIFGHGLGTTPEAKFHIYGKTQASHTMYGELLIEIGFIGMILFLRMIINLRRQITFSLRAENDEFYGTLFKVINIVFWMFVVYSINYWGLSQYYWYNLAGLTIAAAMLSKTTLVNGKK